MQWFITRVELHSAAAADYDKLHEAMLAQKFRRTVRSDDGPEYELPTAMYFSHSTDLDAAGVRNIAVLAANTTGRRSYVFTCATSSWALQGQAAI